MKCVLELVWCKFPGHSTQSTRTPLTQAILLSHFIAIPLYCHSILSFVVIKFCCVDCNQVVFSHLFFKFHFSIIRAAAAQKECFQRNLSIKTGVRIKFDPCYEEKCCSAKRIKATFQLSLTQQQRATVHNQKQQ